jgi:hypothetical protein
MNNLSVTLWVDHVIIKNNITLVLIKINIYLLSWSKSLINF